MIMQLRKPRFMKLAVMMAFIIWTFGIIKTPCVTYALALSQEAQNQQPAPQPAPAQPQHEHHHDEQPPAQPPAEMQHDMSKMGAEHQGHDMGDMHAGHHMNAMMNTISGGPFKAMTA